MASGAGGITGGLPNYLVVDIYRSTIVIIITDNAIGKEGTSTGSTTKVTRIAGIGCYVGEITIGTSQQAAGAI